MPLYATFKDHGPERRNTQHLELKILNERDHCSSLPRHHNGKIKHQITVPVVS
jgi:hypothetical protein